MGRTVEIELTDDELAAIERARDEAEDAEAYVHRAIGESLALYEEKRRAELNREIEQAYRETPETADERAFRLAANAHAAERIAKELLWEPEVGRAR